jgi:uracil-DNA glycosylase family 4
MPRNADCEKCPLHIGARNVCIWGEWHGDMSWSGPVVMVVGQSPGRQEDYEGHPFIGPSGALLDQAMAEAGIGRYYVTNAAKCSPEANGVDIDRSHWAACADYLDQEIEAVKPAWILALGNPAVQRLLGKGRVSEVSGKEVWANRHQAWIVPALHPAAILRARGRLDSWTADIRRFGRLVRGELAPPPNVPPVDARLVDSGRKLAGLSRLLITEPAWTYDFETNVPEPRLRSWPSWADRRLRVFSIAFSFDGAVSYTVPLDHPDVDGPGWVEYTGRWLRNLWRRIATHNSLVRIAWNDMFDGLVAYRLSGVLPYLQWDAMMSAHLLDENSWKNLKWNGRARLHWPDWDIDATKRHSIRDLARYNGYDAAATYQLWHEDRVRLTEEPVLERYFHEIDMPKLWFSQRVVANGIHVDRARLARGLWEARKRLHQADEELLRISEGAVKNPRSHPQVARWLYELRGLPVFKMGKKHGSTDEETVNRLARQYPEAKRVLDCRRPAKEITTYYRPIARVLRYSVDSRYHADIRTTSVETGRKASGFHTTPRPEESLARGEMPVRPVFSAPPGHVLLVADYRQLEARLAAWSAAGRPERLEDCQPGTMLWDFLCGTDVYRRFASQPLVLNKPPDRITKDERQRMGKVPVLALLYVISPKGLQEYAWKYYEIDWSLNQATRIHTAFHRLYPEFPFWHRMEEAKLRRRGYAVSAIGRIRRLPGAQAGVGDDIRAGINAPIQSLASDITQEAGKLLCEVIDRHQLPYIPSGDVHDSLLVQSPADRSGHAGRVLRGAMLLAPRRLESMGLRLPPGLIDVEIAAGPWGEGKEMSFATVASGGDSGLLPAVPPVPGPLPLVS